MEYNFFTDAGNVRVTNGYYSHEEYEVRYDYKIQHCHPSVNKGERHESKRQRSALYFRYSTI